MTTAVESSPKSLDPRTLAKLKGLQLRARRIVEGYVAGLHRSPHRGFSIEFAEHREYAPGDDLRYLDWKVFGRTDKFYLKQFEDETNLICQLVLDVSESMQYQGPDSPLSKHEYAQCLAASLAWLVLQQQDAVGLVAFDQQVRASVAPGNSAAHLQQLLSAIESCRPAGRTASGVVLRQLAQQLAKRAVVVVISDLFDDLASLMAGLRLLHRRQHDVIVLHVLDAAEMLFPFDRPTLFKGLEQLPQVVADPRTLRRAYRSELESYLRKVKRACHECQIDYRLLRTDQPLDVALSAFLSSRMVKVR